MALFYSFFRWGLTTAVNRWLAFKRLLVIEEIIG